MSPSKNNLLFIQKDLSSLFKAKVAVEALKKDAYISDIAARYSSPVDLVDSWKKTVENNLKKTDL